jgi:hypothetical protein
MLQTVPDLQLAQHQISFVAFPILLNDASLRLAQEKCKNSLQAVHFNSSP